MVLKFISKILKNIPLSPKSKKWKEITYKRNKNVSTISRIYCLTITTYQVSTAQPPY